MKQKNQRFHANQNNALITKLAKVGASGQLSRAKKQKGQVFIIRAYPLVCDREKNKVICLYHLQEQQFLTGENKKGSGSVDG